jgi:glycosyltransferase involved in cell wall biosynthesis
MIRIAFDERPGNGGPARYVASLVRALEGPEWSVQFVERKQPPATIAEPPSEAAGQKRKPLKDLARFAPRCTKAWLGFRREAGRLASAIRTVPADLFHAQNTGCEETPVAARLAGVRQVLGTFHVDSTYDLARQRSGVAHRALEWYSNRSLHLAIAVSEATKRDWVRRSGIPADRVVTIHNGIDPERFRRRQAAAASRQQLSLPQNALIVGGLGRLDPAKGFADLIEATAILRGRFPSLRLAIAGSGPLREQLAALARARGIAGEVMLLGFQEDVNPFLDACDVFVQSSLCEALGYSLLEAMAHELPAVGTCVGGIPEVIVPGETGFLAPPRNAAGLAAAIAPLLESAELRQRMGRAGRERVVKHFHEADMVRKTLAVYREMLSAQHLSAQRLNSQRSVDANSNP